MKKKIVSKNTKKSLFFKFSGGQMPPPPPRPNDVPANNILMRGGGAPERGIVFEPETGTFIIPEFRKYSLKISFKSVDNYYLLICTEKASKDVTFLFTRKLVTNIKKLRVARPMKFWCRYAWKKSF